MRRRSAPSRLGRLGLQAPVVEILEAAPRDAGRLERALLPLDEPVVLVESPLADERVDLPAAVAAELLRVPLADEAGGHREAAVRAHPAALGRRAAKERVTGCAPSGMAGSAGTVSRAAWTNRSASCLASMRSSQAPGASMRTSVR